MRKGKIIWLYGPSGAGKTTLAKELQKHIRSVLLDGDHMRATVSKDCSFSVEDRTKHLERMAHIAQHLSDNGINVICAFITPLHEHREIVHSICDPVFIEMNGIPQRPDSIYQRPIDGAHRHLVYTPHIDTVAGSSRSVLQYLNSQPLHLYIGRFQPFHEGHKYIIQQSLDKHIPVLIAIKRMYQDDNNPYPAEHVKAHLEAIYANDDVEVTIIPNITNICYGRNVGYGITRIEAPPEIEALSATQIRRKNNDRY